MVKARGLDQIKSEFLKHTKRGTPVLLTMCLLPMHDILPDSKLSVMLVPVIKDKTSRISSNKILKSRGSN